MEKTELKYQLFDQTLKLCQYEQPGQDLFFFTMHDNEYTSVRAGRQMIAKYGGDMIELTHEGTRNIEIHYNGGGFQFDPNRIFSRRGIRRSLQKESNRDHVPEKLSEAVSTFEDFLVDKFEFNQKAHLITLHNITDDLSVHSYRDGAEFSQNASDVQIHTGQHEMDFFLVTDRSLFSKLKKRNWNVVLQDQETVDEDGSLSVWARDHNCSYVNVESKQGHLNMQKRMIGELYELM